MANRLVEFSEAIGRGDILTLLTKMLGDIDLNDLQHLVDVRFRETNEIEFKSSIPSDQRVGDRWITHGDRLHEYGKAKILSELVAFANTDGGTLLIGIDESDDQPRHAVGINPINNCEGLLRRLLDMCEDHIEPRLPAIDGKAIEAVGGQGRGVVLIRAGQSSNAPHRLRSDGQFYHRRGERCVKMTVQEIRDKVMQISRQSVSVQEIFAERAQSHWHKMDRIKREATHRLIGITVSCIPSTPPWSIDDLIKDRDRFWWSGNGFNISLAQRNIPISYPAREFQGAPQIRLRSLQKKTEHTARRLDTSGLVEFQVFRAMPLSEDGIPLPLAWIVSLVAGALAQVQKMRSQLARDAAEFGMQMIISTDDPAWPRWPNDIFGYAATSFNHYIFPHYAVGNADGFTGIIGSIISDIVNHCGEELVEEISMDWTQIL